MCACSLNYSGGRGQRISLVQEFEAILGKVAVPYLLRRGGGQRREMCLINGNAIIRN